MGIEPEIYSEVSKQVYNEVSNEVSNEVYNGDFLLAQEHVSTDFPDGWGRTGGDSSTSWSWLGPPQGPRALGIEHPSGPKAGIIQTLDTAIQAGEAQRWQADLMLETEPAGVKSYLKVYLGAVSQQIFSFMPGSEQETFSRVFATPAGTGGLRLEIGILGAGKLTIHGVAASRLYPPRVLRLDEKGQLYVRQVDSIGQIQKPVYVKVISSVPIPVDVHATVTSDIRNLTPIRDGVRVYGSGELPVATTTDGRTMVQIAGRLYQESVDTLIAGLSPVVTNIWDISTLSVFSYAVYNNGSVSALVKIEISPDGYSWKTDTPEKEVVPGNLEVLVPTCFLRFNRLVCRAGSPTPLKIWFQAQG